MIFYGDSFTDYDEFSAYCGGLKNTIKMKYKKEYDRTFESFEEYVVYRADKILGE